MIDVYLGLGSNLGDRRDQLVQALGQLREHGVHVVRVSPVVESPAMLPDDAPADWNRPFLNLVAHCRTSASPTDVLDGLLHHESDLQIVDHATDTAGFTDQVFGLMHLLGFRFAPRIRDLPDKRPYVGGEATRYPTLAPLIGGRLNVKQIRAQWEELVRLAASIKQGTVTASLMLRKPGSYPRQNGPAVALRDER